MNTAVDSPAGDLHRLVTRIDAHVSAPSPTVPVADLLLLGALVALPGILTVIGQRCEHRQRE